MPEQDSTVYLLRRSVVTGPSMRLCAVYWTLELARAAQAARVSAFLKDAKVPSGKVRAMGSVNEHEIVVEKLVHRGGWDNSDWVRMRRWTITPTVVHGSAVDRLADLDGGQGTLPWFAPHSTEPCAKCGDIPSCESPNGETQLCMTCLLAPLKAAESADA